MSIIGSLPYNLTNGQTADATQVMADLNAIVNAVNNTSTGAASIPGVQSSSYNYAADTGTANNIIVGMSPSPASYTDGTQGNFKAANTNTSTTVNIKYGSLGNKALVIDQAGTLPPVGAIIAGMHYRTEYDSTQDKVILINPSRATGSFTGTLNVGATNTGTINYAILPDGQNAIVVFRVPIFATSSVATMTITGIPAAIVPASSTTTRVQALLQNNGGMVIGWFDVTTTTWTGGFGTNTGSFANPGSNGVRQCVMTIPLS